MYINLHLVKVWKKRCCFLKTLPTKNRHQIPLILPSWRSTFQHDGTECNGLPWRPARRFKTTAGMTSRFHLLQQRGQTLENSRNVTKILKIAIFQGSDPAFQSIILGIHVSFQGVVKMLSCWTGSFNQKWWFHLQWQTSNQKHPLRPHKLHFKHELQSIAGTFYWVDDFPRTSRLGRICFLVPWSVKSESRILKGNSFKTTLI